MNKMYTLMNDPSRDLYIKLLFYSLQICKSFLLVLRPTVPMKSSVNNVLEGLTPYLINKDVQSEWPGTKLLDGTALVYYFDLNKDSVEYLLNISEDLFSWSHPSLPEDLCLLKDNGDPWLVTISHEEDVYLLISDKEKASLLSEIPNLILKEN